MKINIKKNMLLVMLMVQIPLHSNINQPTQWSKEQKIMLGSGLALLGVAASVIGVLAYKNHGYKKEIVGYRKVIEESKGQLQLVSLSIMLKDDSTTSVINSMNAMNLLTPGYIEYACEVYEEFIGSVDISGYGLLMQLISLRNSNYKYVGKPQLLIEVAKVLIKYVDIDHQSEKDGMTALMLAAQYNDRAMLELLLQAGASHLKANQKDNNKSAISYADDDCRNLIVSYMTR